MHKNAAPFAIRVARKFSMVSGADFGMCILVVLLQAFALLWFVQAGTGDIQPENATQEGCNRTGHSREVSATERYGKV